MTLGVQKALGAQHVPSPERTLGSRLALWAEMSGKKPKASGRGRVGASSSQAQSRAPGEARALDVRGLEPTLGHLCVGWASRGSGTGPGHSHRRRLCVGAASAGPELPRLSEAQVP